MRLRGFDGAEQVDGSFRGCPISDVSIFAVPLSFDQRGLLAA